MAHSDDFYRGIMEAVLLYREPRDDDRSAVTLHTEGMVRVATTDRNAAALAALADLGIRGAKTALRGLTTTPKRRPPAELTPIDDGSGNPEPAPGDEDIDSALGLGASNQ